MNILLLGEFSAFHKNLKDGFEELGHNAVLASFGDGYKNIPSDISFNPKYKGLIAKLENRINPILSLPELKKFDVVQLINPFAFHFSFFPTEWFYKQIKNNNGKFFISACGSDAYYWQISRKKLKYGPFEDTKIYDHKKKHIFLESKKAFDFNKRVIENSNGVIPVMYDYKCGYEKEKKLKKLIPLPINTNSIPFEENILEDKLTIFHGLTRYGFKGTKYVEEAFKVLKKTFGSKIEVIIKGNLPLNKYLALLDRANIIIDQVNTYSSGMNALYSLSKGKVVLGGAESESLIAQGIESSPVVNVKPTSESIVDAIKPFIENPQLVKKTGLESRLFAERHHDAHKIAKKYLEIYES